MSHAVDHNSVVGTLGTVLTLTLSQINTIVSLAVGLVTLVYMVIKTVNLIRDRKNGVQQSDIN